MCQTSVTEVYRVTVLQPHTNISEIASISDAAILAAFLVAVAAMLVIYYKMTAGHDPLANHSGGSQRNRLIRGRMAAAMILCFIFAIQGMALCQNSDELTVLGPADNFIGNTIREISQSFSDANRIPVNITQIKGREMIAKEALKNTSNVDVVILEKEYPLFNLSGMKKLEKGNAIDNYTYLYSENALLIVRKDEAISTLGDLNGTVVAGTDSHVPGACLAKKIVEGEHLNASLVNGSSNEAQLDAVVAGSADATMLWENMFSTYANSTNPEIKSIDLKDYRMDNFIAVLNKSKNPDEAEIYVKYLLASLANSSNNHRLASIET